MLHISQLQSKGNMFKVKMQIQNEMIIYNLKIV